MTDNFIQLEKPKTIKFDIKDDKGNMTGEFLEFNLLDIELPIIYQEMLENIKKNKTNLKNQCLIIDKRQDVKGKKLMSKNQEDKIKATQEFIKKQVEVYNCFLGKDGVKKLLNGQPLTWETLEDIDMLIAKYIIPKLDLSMESIEKRIKEKYSIATENDVLK